MKRNNNNKDTNWIAKLAKILYFLVYFLDIIEENKFQIYWTILIGLDSKDRVARFMKFTLVLQES